VQRFDVIVLGVGVMGAAACWHLARRGLRVLGLDAYDIPNERGSSHGQTRICRQAYFEHPDYVPLVRRAYAMWDELQNACGRELFCRCGLLLAGPPQGGVITGVRRAAETHGLALEEVPRSAWPGRFAMFRPDAAACVLFEPDAGFLRAEECVDALARQAEVRGATLRTGQRVRSWCVQGSAVRVATQRDEYVAGALVITAGAWACGLLGDLRPPLSVRRKVQLWFQTRDDRFTLQRGCPVFGFQVQRRFFYGFPALDASGVKVSEHTRGMTIVDPDGLDRNLRPHDVQPVHRFTQRYLRGVESEVTRHEVCMYTMTSDEHFIVDRHPGYSQVVFATGFSGHGFKFAPLIGSVLADLVIDGATREPIGFLRLARFASGGATETQGS